MTSEGNGWLKCTIPAPSSYVMFHTNSQQEPGANETGYLVSGEAWVQNKKLSFSSKVITSHIDAATGEKIADDEILIQSKVSSDDTYKTSPLPGRTDVIAPVNASGNLSSGIINVVYLYTSSERPSTAPSTVTPTTEKTGKTYDATVVLEDDGQYANFRLEFDQQKGGKR